MVTSHNPFRAGPLSPAATGNSINPPPSFHTVAGDGETTLNPLTDTVPDLPSIPEAADQERDLPPIPQETRRPFSSPVITLEPPPPPIQEEELPAYTAIPDIRRGESTLDVGPRRPFQQSRSTPSSPRPAQGQGLTPSFTGPTTTTSSNPNYSFAQRHHNRNLPNLIQQITGSLVDQLQNVAFGPSTGDGQSNQGARSAPRHARSFSSFTPNPGPSTSPPPLRQTPSAPRLSPDPSDSQPRSPSMISNSTTASAAARSTASGAVSDFARDFYAAGSAHGLLRLDPDSDDHHSRGRSRGVDIPPELRISPPPLPPRRHSSFEASQIATSSLAPQSQSHPSASSPTLPVIDNSRPTSKPVPGHPLLRDGKLLLYPKDHTCPKCFNVGYKRGDPRKPCKKCWSKFGKPYTPALMYAPSTNATTTLQRPLPVLAQPPPQSPANLPPLARAPSAPAARQQGPARSSSSCGAYQSNSVRSHRYSPSEPPSMPNRTPPFGPSLVISGAGSPPPAGAPVYPAGDRRLGGVRCWMCGGTGTVSFIFYHSQCDTCKGIGRWYM